MDTQYEQYERVTLKDGRTATIVEILGDQDAFIVDIDLECDWETDCVLRADIESKNKEVK